MYAQSISPPDRLDHEPVLGLRRNWRQFWLLVLVNAFVGGMREGEVAPTGQLQRIVFNENWEEMRREVGTPP